MKIVFTITIYQQIYSHRYVFLSIFWNISKPSITISSIPDSLISGNIK